MKRFRVHGHFEELGMDRPDVVFTLELTAATEYAASYRALKMVNAIGAEAAKRHFMPPHVLDDFGCVDSVEEVDEAAERLKEVYNHSDAEITKRYIGAANAED